MTPHEALSSVPTEPRLSSDDRLETVLVHLLGRLEQQLSTLQRTDNVKRMIRMVESSLGMLVTIIDSGVENFDVQFFSHELPAVWRLRERSKVVLDVLDREGWTSVFGLSSKANSSTQVMHRNLAKSFGQIYRDLLNRFSEEFQSSKLRDDFRASTDAFVEDFVGRW